MSFGIAPPEQSFLFEHIMLLGFIQPNIIIGIALTMFCGTMVGWFANKRIRYYKTIKLRVRSHKIKAKQLLQVLEGLARTSCDQRVRELIGESLIEVIEQIMDINPMENGVKIIHPAVQKLMSLPSKQITHDISIADSDVDIRHLQKLTLAALAHLKKLPRRGHITYSECSSLERHLKMIYVQIGIDAHLQKADLAAESGEKGTAGYHYRIAQNKLAQSRYHGPDKKQKMIQIGDTIRSLFDKEESKAGR